LERNNYADPQVEQEKIFWPQKRGKKGKKAVTWIEKSWEKGPLELGSHRKDTVSEMNSFDQGGRGATGIS